MFTKLKAIIRKETIILLRDKIGLSILFLMPMVLIFVMTIIQDAAFRSINESSIPIVFVNNDKDSLGDMVEQGLRNNELCKYYDSINGKPATLETARQAVADGKFLLGIVVPQNATKAIRENVSQLIDESINPAEAAAAIQGMKDSVEIIILIDPVTKKSFISSITSALREFISEVKTKIMFETFSEQIAEVIPEGGKKPGNTFNRSQIFRYSEQYASKNNSEIIPNAVQHNVPAWTIFAMFFIAIPLCGSIMKEKSEGSIFRLHTMPTSYLLLMQGKVVVYVIVGLIQFLLMLCVGLYILPLFGLPPLVMGDSISGILVLTLATSLAATGYGVLVGTLANTEQQGAILGSLSVLLLSALGGIWVPTYVMSKTMRDISEISPLNWALEGYYNLFLRNDGLNSVLPATGKLLAFFVITIAIAMAVNKMKRKI